MHPRCRAPRRPRPCAIAPDPVPRSTTTGRRPCSRARRLDRPAGQQLGLGSRHEDAGPDPSSTCRKGARRSGAAAARARRGARPARRTPRRRSAGTSSTSGQPGRSTPSTWASSDLRVVTPGTSTPRLAEPGALPRRRARRRAGTQSPSASASTASSRACEVGLDAGVDDGLELAVEHLVEVVGLEAGAVVGDAGSRGSCRCGSARSGRPCGPGSGAPRAPRPRPPPGPRRAAGRAGCAAPAPCSAAGDFSFWQETTMPVGRWVIRTAESVVLTL